MPGRAAVLIQISEMTPHVARFDSSTRPILLRGAWNVLPIVSVKSQGAFPSEVNLHFPGIDNLTKPTVRAFPKSLVCLDCGFTEFVIEETELRLLRPNRGTRAVASDQMRIGIHTASTS